MKIFTVVKSAAVSVVVTAALIMISAALAYFFGLSDEVTGMIMFAASAVSVLIGSVTAAKGCDGHRIVCCLLSAALYLIIVFAAAVIVHGRILFGTHFAATVAASVFAAVVGCLIGGRR